MGKMGEVAEVGVVTRGERLLCNPWVRSVDCVSTRNTGVESFAASAILPPIYQAEKRYNGASGETSPVLQELDSAD